MVSSNLFEQILCCLFGFNFFLLKVIPNWQPCSFAFIMFSWTSKHEPPYPYCLSLAYQKCPRGLLCVSRSPQFTQCYRLFWSLSVCILNFPVLVSLIWSHVLASCKLPVRCSGHFQLPCFSSLSSPGNALMDEYGLFLIRGPYCFSCVYIVYVYLYNICYVYKYVMYYIFCLMLPPCGWKLLLRRCMVLLFRFQIAIRICISDLHKTSCINVVRLHQPVPTPGTTTTIYRYDGNC